MCEHDCYFYNCDKNIVDLNYLIRNEERHHGLYRNDTVSAYTYDFMDYTSIEDSSILLLHKPTQQEATNSSSLTR